MGAWNNLAEWHKLPISLSELCINTTLRCGQSFRWRKNDAGVWSMALHNRILSLYQDPEHLYYRSIWPSPHAVQAPPTPPSSHPPSVPEDDQDDDTLDLLHHYFNLSPNASSLYTQWSASDPNFAQKAPRFTGIRILNQDAWEALIGFICSSNNNISRISRMVHNLCTAYGPLINHLDDDDEPYHDFPTPHALAQPGVEPTLRALGFGYRAKYIHQTALTLVSQAEGWLDSLRNPACPLPGTPPAPAPAGEWHPSGRAGYRRAHAALLALHGVGPKVADCVCLMGLGWSEAVPVDTHVWQIAQRDYRFGKGRRASLTKATYDAVGDKLRGLWGVQAGWAQSVLFTANLRAFGEQLKGKGEVKEEEGEEVVLKLEEGEGKEKVLHKSIKREPEDGERSVLEVEETVVRSKRRRRN